MTFIHRFYLLIFLLVAVLNSACNTTKYIDLDKAFLTKNEIEIQGQKKGKMQLRDQLETLYKQTPTKQNRRWLYYQSKGRFQRRFAEKPAIYDLEITNKTAESMKFYLQNKGFYEAQVRFDKTIKRQHAKVKYYVELNPQCRINDLQYKCNDEKMLAIIESIKSATFLKKNVPLELSAYQAEVARITKHVRNQGYANFYANYFSPIIADTTAANANVTMEVLVPKDTTHHKIYKIGTIQVFTEFSTTFGPNKRDSLLDGVTFTSNSGEFALRLQRLLDCISFRSGNTFRQENLDLAYLKLEQLKAFRLVNIKQNFPQARPYQVDIIITLAQVSKYSLDGNLETNTTTGGSRGSNIGFSVSGTFKNNNVKKGAERYSLFAEGGFQGARRDTSQFFDVKIQNEYYLPKLLDVYGLWKGLNNVSFGKKQQKIDDTRRKLVSDNFYNNLKNNAQTKFSAGFNYISTFDLRYILLNMNYGYVVTPSPLRRVAFNHTGVEYLRPLFLGPAIDSLEFQKRRFSTQFVTALLLRDLSFSRQNVPNEQNLTWTMRTAFEQSGAELFAANQLYNLVAIKDKSFNIFGADYSRFVKGEFEYTVGKKLTNAQSVHFHSNLGLAVPYGFDALVPFVKQFYVGGPSSIRAWRVRELGPGGFNNTERLGANQLFYQTGDVKMEFNVEYRFKIYWIFKGAFFLDAGNVWLLYPNENLPRAAISKDFYKQIAIGSGVGLRVDVDYSVIRFDFGYRIKNQFFNPTTNSYWAFKTTDGTNDKFRLKNFNMSIALGYPF